MTHKKCPISKSCSLFLSLSPASTPLLPSRTGESPCEEKKPLFEREPLTFRSELRAGYRVRIHGYDFPGDLTRGGGGGVNWVAETKDMYTLPHTTCSPPREVHFTPRPLLAVRRNVLSDGGRTTLSADSSSFIPRKKYRRLRVCPQISLQVWPAASVVCKNVEDRLAHFYLRHIRQVYGLSA